MKWKFFHNGNGWWLRIESIDELIEYQKFGNRATMAFDGYFKHKTDGSKLDNLSLALQMIGEKENCTAVEAANKLQFKFYESYLRHLEEDSFININRMGGCNSIDWEMKQVIYKDNLSFPSFTEKDIVIKTFKPYDYRPNYQYHYYAYLGNFQLKDGNKTKWDTEKEAKDFAVQFIS